MSEIKLCYSKKDVEKKIVVGVNVKNKNKINHRFTGFDNYEELFNILKKKNDINRCYFEVIKPNCKPYLDIEFNPNDHKDISPNIINDIINDIIIIFNNIYHLELSSEDILLGESHKYDETHNIIKYSWHIIIDPLNYTYIYENNRFDNTDCACDLLYQLHEKNPIYIELIDRSVYSNQREMRMFLCNKTNDNVRLIKYNKYSMKTISFDEYKRTFINYVDPNKEIKYIHTIYRSNPKKILHTKLEAEKIEQNKLKFEQNKKIRENNKKNRENNNNNNEKNEEIILNNNSNFINDIMNNIGSYRADNYDNWIEIMFILKNQSIIDNINYYELFNTFSKNSVKYDEKEVKEYWDQNNGRKNNGLTIGTLIYYLIQDNKEAWDVINKKYNKIDADKIIKDFYYPDIKKYNFNEIIEYEDKTTRDFKIRDGNKGLFIDIEMGMGKTDTILKQIRNHNDNIIKNINSEKFLNYDKIYKKILIISHRRTLCGKFFGDLQDMNFNLYFEYKTSDEINVDKLIIQLDSLHKVSLQKYDLLLLDECESLFSHFMYDNMKHKTENINMLQHHIQNAERVVLMDANMSIKSFEIMKQIDDLSKYTYIHNKYQILKDFKMEFMNGDEQTEKIKNDINNNKNIVVASLSKTLVDAHYSKIIPNNIIFSSDTSNEDKFYGVMDIDNKFKNKNILYTPSISAGVSCTIKNQFENIYGYANCTSANSSDFLQMLRRVRYPIQKQFQIFYEDKHINKPYHLLSIEDIEDYIKYSCIIDDKNEIVKNLNRYIKNSKYEVTKDLYYHITVWNLLERNINKCFFLETLKILSKTKGIDMRESNKLYDKKQKSSFDKNIKEEKEILKNKIYDDLSKTNPISHEDYEKINIKMNREQTLTIEEKNKHKLQTLLNKYKYNNGKFNRLNNEDKFNLIEFMDDDNNHEIFINKCNLKLKENVDSSIGYIKELDIQRKNNNNNDIEYKQYHRKHLLIDKMIKLLGYNNIEDYETVINNDNLKKNMSDNNDDLLNIINEINYINKIKQKYKITDIKTINTILKNTYGHKIERLRNRTKDKKMTIHYYIKDLIQWGNSYLPSLPEKNKFDDFMFN